MGHRISARCLSYCHIATLAGRSQNTPTRLAHQHTCDSMDVHAHLRRMQYRSALVIPANEGLQSLPDTPTLFRPQHSGTLAPNSGCQSQRNEVSARASQPCHPDLCGHSCNCPALRLSRLAAGIISPGSFGRPYRFAHSHALRLEPIGVHRAAAISLRDPRPDLIDRMPETCPLALAVGTIQSSGPG